MARWSIPSTHHGDDDTVTDDPVDYDQRADGTTWPRAAFANPDAGAYELTSYPIYVDVDATAGANDGSSWADAFTALQDALAVAASGDQVWIAEGVYYDVGAAEKGTAEKGTVSISDQYKPVVVDIDEVLRLFGKTIPK